MVLQRTRPGIEVPLESDGFSWVQVEVLFHWVTHQTPPQAGLCGLTRPQNLSGSHQPFWSQFESWPGPRYRVPPGVRNVLLHTSAGLW